MVISSWLAEEMIYKDPLTLKKFVEVFHTRFFLALTKKEIQKMFLELQQGDWTINAYAAELVGFKKFVPTLMAKE